MKVTIGAPPFDLYAIANTCSDLCFPQKKTKYDPSTYRNVACPSRRCHLLDTTRCHPPANTCKYMYEYGDLSLTKGVPATETPTLTSTMGPPMMLPNVVFSTGHNNSGIFTENDMGIVGLGKCPASLISQMGSSFGGRRFSQCLVPFDAPPTVTRKMIFGSGSEVSRPSTVTTALVAVKNHPNLYCVTLSGISVGSSCVPFNPSRAGAITKGNMILDSGTNLMLVPLDFFNRLEAEAKRVVKLPPFDDPNLRPLPCYGMDVLAKGPVLTAHFDGKANVKLKQTRTFIEAKDGLVCLAMDPTYSPRGIFGNNATHHGQL